MDAKPKYTFCWVDRNEPHCNPRKRKRKRADNNGEPWNPITIYRIEM